MRVWSLTAPGLEHLTLEQRPDPIPGPNDVVVRVKAASLNYRDLMIATGRYSRGAKYLLIPLSDGAGEIAAVGSGVRTMNRALSLHRIRSVVDRSFRFDEARVALDHLQSAAHFGKIVVVA
jgi:NADPH:quinone reductase-like Zn-dependent oxidoreductase